MPKITSITGPVFVSMVRSGAAHLFNNRKTVNDLNVFPVPDGDTGDNMSLTISSAVDDVRLEEPLSLEKTSDIIASDLLLGARGNSGVILSRIFKGLSKGFSGVVTADLSEFSYALKIAVSEAYSAVSTPVEGTILTVIRDATENTSVISEYADFVEFFEAFLAELRASVERTPDLLPSLKDAGVVDSGGVGLVYIFEGFLLALRGEPVSADHSDHIRHDDELDISLFDEDSELEFGYCTEFLLRLQTLEGKNQDFSLDQFKSDLAKLGDSIVAFRDGSVVKAHIHTRTPGDVLALGQEYGEFLKLKIENMSLQHNSTTIDNSYNPLPDNLKKKNAIVAVSPGQGITDSFTELGVDYVISGGQTMNPSTEDFLTAFREVHAHRIFVYPNNKNIIMSATQAAELCEDAEIVIIPTRTIGEGYIAVSMLDTSSDDSEDILASQLEIISSVTTGLVARAERDTKSGDIEVHSGDYLGYTGKDILVAKKSSSAALTSLADALNIGDYDIAIIIYGSNVSEKSAQKVSDTLTSANPLTEVTLISGQQPIEDYILILN